MSMATPIVAPVEREDYLNKEYGVASWLLTTDHKRIALLYLISITFFFFIGGFFALLIRLELLTPAGDLVQADTYNKLFTMHGQVMVFFFLIPSIPAVLGNFLIPMMIGAKDLAFPRINLLSWYIFIIAGALTDGDLNVTECNPSHLGALLQKLQEVGIKTRLTKNSVRVEGNGPLKAADVITEEYPGFPTDVQAQYMVLATQAEGTSVVTENIFENRFMHAGELARMGANIKVEGSRAIVRGKTPLSSAAVQCSDLRASASLVIAALVADGETIIDRVYHVDRGYERIEEKLKGVGAQIRRIGEILPKRAAVPSVVA